MKVRNFRDYLEDVEKEYKYRIKFVVELDKDNIGRLERHLEKYDLKDISSVETTPIQKHPLDFPNISAAAVNMVNVVTSLPMPTSHIVHELAMALTIPHEAIAVRAEDDPYEIKQQHDMDDADEVYDIRLSIDPAYPDDPAKEYDGQLYGDSYNQSMLKELDKIRNSKTNRHTGEEGTSYVIVPKPKVKDAGPFSVESEDKLGIHGQPLDKKDRGMGIKVS